jgi:hypothetical protein
MTADIKTYEAERKMLNSIDKLIRRKKNRNPGNITAKVKMRKLDRFLRWQSYDK